MNGKHVARAALGLTLIGAAVLLFTQDLTSPAGVRNAVDGSSVAAPLVFVAIYVVLTVLLVPGAVGSTAAGVLFGAAWGTALTVFGATAGATIAFLIARALGREQVERLAGPKVAAVDRWFSERGLGAVLFVRLVPLFPFNAVNYGAGLSGLSFRTYVVGTGIGIVPGTVAFVGLGAGLGDPGSSTFLASLGLLAVMSAVGFVALRVAGRRAEAEG